MTDLIEEAALLPCPFCGGDNLDECMNAVSCLDCGGGILNENDEGNLWPDNELASRWNTRATVRAHDAPLYRVDEDGTVTQLACSRCSDATIDTGELEKRVEGLINATPLMDYTNSLLTDLLTALRAKEQRVQELEDCPLKGDWRINGGFLCCGTLRIMRADFDTNPSDEFKQQLFDWMERRLNAPTKTAGASDE